MAYQAIAARQVKTSVVTAEDGTVTITPDSAVAAGSTLVVIGASVHADSNQATTLTSCSDTSTNTWGTPTNVRSGTSYAPNVFGCVAENVASGSPTVTLNLGYASDNRVSFALIEVEKCVTSSGVDKTKTGTSSGATSTSTAATGTLTQTDNLVILCAGGWFGAPTNPSGWTNVLNLPNGTGSAVGCQISYKNVTTDATITGTVAHESASGAALMYVIKAAAAGAALRYKFLLNSSTLTSADTGITGYVWRNCDPDTGYAEKYTGLEGDASAGVLYVDSGLPAGVDVGDTIVGSFYNSTDGSRPFVAGTVEEV